MEATSHLRINVLGELTASYDDASLDLGGRRQRAVLARLVVARGDVVPADALADAVWGDRLPRDVSGALQSYVSHLRRGLHPGAPARSRAGVIAREGTGYALRTPDDSVDAWRFESSVRDADDAAPEDARILLSRALALWRGPALVEYADQPWAESEAARLGELRLAARERLLAVRLELEEPGLLVPDVEAMVADDPLREERWRLLVLALYRAHRQADALAALRRARAVLADELGVDPGPALRQLEAEVLAQSPSLAGPSRARRETSRVATQPDVATTAVGDRPSPPTATGPAPVGRDEGLVERDDELGVLREVVEGLATGRSRLVLVEGPAGLGKSRLVEEARRLAGTHGLRVVSARGSQLESSYAYGVVRQLFEPALADVAARDRLLDGADGARGVFAATGPEPPTDGFGVLSGLHRLVLNFVVDGPLLLTLDDAQWCDVSSLRFVTYLARRLGPLPLAVVASVRTGNEPGPQDDLLAELALEPDVVTLQPRTLSERATSELVARRLGTRPDPRFTAACHRTTSGNPLLLNVLLKALAADGVRPDASHADHVVAVGSRAISSMVLLRLRRLPDEALTVAQAAAVLGDGAALPHVAALAGLPEDATAAALSVLVRAEIVGDRQPVSFGHPLVRDAVHQSMPAAERGLRHEQAARVLESAGADEEQVVAHLLLAPPRGDERVVARLRSAARTAAGRGVSDSAVTYLRRALAEGVPADTHREVVLQLGLVEAAVDGTAAVEHLVRAYHLHTEPEVRASIAVAAASTQVFASPPGVATAFARDAAAVLPEELVDQRQALVALQRMSAFMHGLEDGWHTPAPEPDGDGPGARMLAATHALEALLAGHDRARAVRLARFALDDDVLLAVDDGLFWVNSAIVRILADDDIGTFWARARAAASARGSVFGMLSVNLWEGFWRWRRGELHEALMRLREALEQDRMWGGSRVGEPFARSFEIGCHLDRGDVAAARQAADAVNAGQVHGEGGRLFLLTLAQLLLAEGRPDDALHTLDLAPEGIPTANPVWNPRRLLTGLALAAQGRNDEALSIVAEEVGRLRSWGAPSHLGRGLCLLGQLQGPAGADTLREAVQVLATTSAGVDLAQARCALGTHAAVPDDEAVPLLLAARETGVRQGAVALQEAACAALTERGHPVDVRRPSRPLTSTERQVLDLTRAGVPVEAIARQLFVGVDAVRALLDDLATRDGSTEPSGFSQLAGISMGTDDPRRHT